MPGNTLGKNFRVTTWGESHGVAYGVVIDGCPAGLYISEKEIQEEVNRRKPLAGSKASTSRIEEDKIRILSGIFEGKTLGTPISIIVENKNTKSGDYEALKSVYRPGHADYSYDLKYGIRDPRGGGRSSGRETISRVMGGAVAKKILRKHSGTEFFGHTIQVGHIQAKKFDKKHLGNDPIRCADKEVSVKMMKLIDKLRKEGDSIGAIVEIIIKNPPKGLGEPVFDKLSAELAKAMMSIGAVKGVEIGDGFKVATMKGSENNDQMRTTSGKVKFLSNHSGGILGGISTGADIVLRLAIKPVASISKKQKTITKSGKNTTVQIFGRHDCCLAPRIIPVAESMAALVLANFLKRK
ncbi:MAG: chorismate synthase [Candidatus Gracilibacteria bacterium]|jgi:chorismate synthase